MNHCSLHAGQSGARQLSRRLLAAMFIVLGFTAGLFGAISCNEGRSLASTAVPAIAQGHSPSSLGVLRADLPAAAPMRQVGIPGLPFRGPDLLEGTSEQSTNWAGYDAIGGGFTSVTASWVQPAIAPTSSETYAAFWAGLDGDGSSTVEQTGTLAYSENGEVYYEAWYEMYPAATQIVPLTINPGDSLTATVTSESGGQFDLTLTDHTTSKTANETETNTAAQDYSAEVIAEAPSSGTHVLPLADFGTVGFTGCAFNDLPISAFAWNQIDMVSGAGSTEATTSALGGDGASFSVSRALTLSGFTPTSGQVGSRVTLTGSRFSDATAVSFNGTAATFTVDSDTQITATVPAGASSGPITVTAPAGSAVSTASFTVTALSADDSLKSLTVSAGALSPAFAASTLSYTDSVANSVTSISVTATPTDSNASALLEVGGASVANPIALNVGTNPIDVVVSAQDGAQQTYVLTVTRAAALSADDSLKSLTVSAGALSPAFAASTLSYTDSVANSVTSISVTATPTDSNASALLEVGGASVANPIALNVGTNPIDVVVSAQDGAQQTYVLTVTRAAALSADDSLKSLTVSAGALSPAFAASTLSYTDSVANSVTSISVTATPTDSNASALLEVGGASVANPIALNVGTNPIDVVVSAQDGAQQTYVLTVTRAVLIVTPHLTLKLSGLRGGALKLGKRLTVKGTMAPVSSAGGKVTLAVQRRHDGRWLKVTARARTISGAESTYGWKYKPARKGIYRVRATIAKTAMRAGAATTWRRFKVK